VERHETAIPVRSDAVNPAFMPFAPSRLPFAPSRLPFAPSRLPFAPSRRREFFAAGMSIPCDPSDVEM
jgi:hypothetical protein